MEETMSLLSASLSTSITVAAAPDVVWRVLTDFDGYGSWNPYYPRAEGDVVEGSTITLHAALPGGRTGVGRCRLRTVRPREELRWTSHLVLPGIMDADHRFRLVPVEPGRTRLEQDETLRGLLIPVGGSIVAQVRQGCEAMADALRVRAEGISAA
jgi:hypothetical protein